MTTSIETGLPEDLHLVRDFLVGAVEAAAGHEIPHSPGVPGENGSQALRQWVDLLDMALTPEMLRLGLGSNPDPGLCAALLRYYVSRSNARGMPDPKLDCVAASLCRVHFGAEAKDTSPAVGFSRLRLSTVLTDLERQFRGFLLELPTDDLTNEARKLAADLDLLCQDAGALQSWEQWVSANVLGRLAALRDGLGPSLAHPRVLAALALIFVVLEHRMSFLVEETSCGMIAFATRIRSLGSELVWLERSQQAIQGLQDLARTTDCQQQLAERLQAVADLRDSRSVMGRPAAAGQAGAQQAGADDPPPELVPAKLVPEMEENRLLDLQLAVCTALRKTEPGQDVKLKLPAYSLALSATEADAFRFQYDGEKSFRADCGSALRQAVLVRTRLACELEKYKERVDSTYLWQAHARALGYLLSVSDRALAAVLPVLAAAEQRGLLDRAAALAEARHRLLLAAQESQELLQQRASLDGSSWLPEPAMSQPAAAAVSAIH